MPHWLHTSGMPHSPCMSPPSPLLYCTTQLACDTQAQRVANAENCLLKTIFAFQMHNLQVACGMWQWPSAAKSSCCSLLYICKPLRRGGWGACKSPCCCMQIDRRKSLLIFEKKKEICCQAKHSAQAVRQWGEKPIFLFQFSAFSCYYISWAEECKVNSTIIIYRIPVFLFAYFLGNFPYKFSPIFIYLVPALFL